MEAALYDTCARLGLTGLGVNVFGAPAKPYIGVYVHWREGDEHFCASGSSQTFNDALAIALLEKSERCPRRTG